MAGRRDEPVRHVRNRDEGPVLVRTADSMMNPDVLGSGLGSLDESPPSADDQNRGVFGHDHDRDRVYDLRRERFDDYYCRDNRHQIYDRHRAYNRDQRYFDRRDYVRFSSAAPSLWPAIHM